MRLPGVVPRLKWGTNPFSRITKKGTDMKSKNKRPLFSYAWEKQIFTMEHREEFEKKYGRQSWEIVKRTNGKKGFKLLTSKN